MIPVTLALNLANKLAGKVLDKLDIESTIITGVVLKRDLGLENFDYVYIQRIMGISPSIYVISYDSRYIHRYIPRNKLMDLQSSKFTRLKTIHKDEFEFSALKLSPPFDLDQINPHVNTASVFVLRDLAGVYFSSGDITHEINESLNKYNVYTI